jgi:ABC-type enterobactin transport system permease subunit
VWVRGHFPNTAIGLFSIRYGLVFVLLLVSEEGDIMQMAITFMAVVGGMVFSLAVALVAEELIFGQVFRLFFASGKLSQQRVAVKSEQKQ